LRIGELIGCVISRTSMMRTDILNLLSGDRQAARIYRPRFAGPVLWTRICGRGFSSTIARRSTLPPAIALGESRRASWRSDAGVRAGGSFVAASGAESGRAGGGAAAAGASIDPVTNFLFHKRCEIRHG